MANRIREILDRHFASAKERVARRAAEIDGSPIDAAELRGAGGDAYRAVRVVRRDALHVDRAGREIQVQSVAVQVQRIWRGVVTATEVEVAAADRRVADQVDARRPALVLVP